MKETGLLFVIFLCITKYLCLLHASSQHYMQTLALYPKANNTETDSQTQRHKVNYYANYCGAA